LTVAVGLNFLWVARWERTGARGGAARTQDGAFSGEGSRARRAWIIFGVAAVAAAVYAPAMRNQYTADDSLIESTQTARAHAPLSTLFDRYYFDTYKEEGYRPFATLTTMVDARIGLDPRHAGHAQSILWFAGTAALLAAFASRFLPLAAAAFAGLAFAVHPVTTEATVSIGYREDCIVACLLLASLLLTLRRSAAHRALALALYALALFTKESAGVFPALLVLVRVTVERERPFRWRPLAAELAGYALVTVAYLVVRVGLLTSTEPFADPVGGTYARTLVAVPRIFAHYLRVLVEPWPLSASYEHVFPLGASWISQLPWLAIDVAFLALAARLASTRPALGLGLAWFAVALTPALHLVPLRVEAADRLVHLAIVGGALAAGASFAMTTEEASRSGRRICWTCGAAALACLLVLTERRIADWHDDHTLWTETLRRNPRSYMAHASLASELEAAGQHQSARSEMEAAVADCPRASHFGRTRFCALFASKLGFLSLFRMGDLAAARAAFGQSIAFSAEFTPAVIGLGYVELAEGNLDAARRQASLAAGQNSPRPIVQQMLTDFSAQIDRAGRPPF
jgi:hypothetical protein